MRGETDRHGERRVAVIGLPRGRGRSDGHKNDVLASLEQWRKSHKLPCKNYIFLVFPEISPSTLRVKWLFLL